MEQVLVLTSINAGITRLYSSEWIPLMIPLLEGMNSYWIVHLPSLGEVLTRPAQENGHFRTSYVQAERETVRKKLESIVNDKMRYAAERSIEEMCKNEPTVFIHWVSERICPGLSLTH